MAMDLGMLDRMVEEALEQERAAEAERILGEDPEP